MLLQIGNPLATGHDPATELMPQGNRVEMRAFGKDSGISEPHSPEYATRTNTSSAASIAGVGRSSTRTSPSVWITTDCIA